MGRRDSRPGFCYERAACTPVSGHPGAWATNERQIGPHTMLLSVGLAGLTNRDCSVGLICLRWPPAPLGSLGLEVDLPVGVPDRERFIKGAMTHA